MLTQLHGSWHKSKNYFCGNIVVLEKLYVRMREQPEAVGPSEERARRGVANKTLEGKQPTASKQMTESENKHCKE